MIEAMRRFLLRRSIRRWKIMHAKYLFTIRAEREFSKMAWEGYRPRRNYRDPIDR